MLFKVNNMKTIFDLKDNALGICIHKYVGCGNNLYLTCHKMNINTYDLFTEDMGEAIRKSQEIISKTLMELTLNAKAFILDDSDIEYTNW